MREPSPLYDGGRIIGAASVVRSLGRPAFDALVALGRHRFGEDGEPYWIEETLCDIVDQVVYAEGPPDGPMNERGPASRQTREPLVVSPAEFHSPGGDRPQLELEADVRF